MATPEPAWLTQARSLMGIKEGAGTQDNPEIIGWAKELGGWIASYYTHDSIPWCGLFVGICMKRSNLPLPANALGALQWSTWGQHLTSPVPGAVLCFTRPGGGHVSFYVGEDEECYHILGGNQSDSVDITREPKARCVAMRWPEGVEVVGAPVVLSPSGVPVSQSLA